LGWEGDEFVLLLLLLRCRRFSFGARDKKSEKVFT
jgi:hypothetical protein